MSIARSLLLALLGLTLALAVIAGLGVASLYDGRQDYEDALVHAYETESAASNLLAAGVIEEAVLRTGSRDAAGQRAREQARSAYGRAADAAHRAAVGDAASLRILSGLVAAQAAARAGGADATAQLRRSRRDFTLLAERQRDRRVAARDRAADDAHRALITIAIAGTLALLAAGALVATLVAGLRRPLDDLVTATRRLAAGDLDVRVGEAGPAELRQLGRSFNGMAADLRAAREQLDRERRRLATIISSLGDALLVAGPDGTITEVNPRAGELVPELVPGSVPSAVLPPLEEAVPGEVQIEHHGATLAVTVAPLELPGGESGHVWTVRDVSERARLERLKSEFVATASHELRSPLTSIKGFAELLSQSRLSAKQREQVDIIRLSTDRLVDLTNDLLDVARIEAGGMEVQRRPLDVGQTAAEVAALLLPRIQEKGQVLEIGVVPDTPAALADPPRIRQVLVNLLTNAHLYTPEGGRIELDVHGDGDEVAIVVADTGPGMTEEEQRQVFERFFRARGASSGQAGSGLGLAIVRSIVDLHDGRIKVDSAPGQGSKFTVWLPRAGVEAPLVRPPREVLRGRRVLIVDDEPDTAALIAEQLAPYAVETALAYDGESAIAELRRREYDVVTLDIVMQGMSGFEVLRRIRDDPQLRVTPVVVVTALSSSGSLGGESVIGKPVNAEELADALGAAILSGRSRVLVICRASVQPRLEPAFARLGIDSAWSSTAEEAAQLCADQRFEVALVDAGLPTPEAIMASLDLRGRRPGRGVVMFSTGDDATGVDELPTAPVPVEEAGNAVLAALGMGVAQ